MAKKDRKQEKPNKKKSPGLFAALFAPLDELENNDIDYDIEFDDEEPLDENGELIHLFDDDEVEYSEEEDIEAADSLVWDDGERVVLDYDAFEQSSPDDEDLPSEDEPAQGKRRKKKHQEQLPDDRDLLGEVDPLPEEIQLFDDEEEAPQQRSGGRTRIFRTGSSTATRININETQTVRAIDEAQKKNREIEAKQRREQQARKEARRKKRVDFIKRFAMNLLFGLFIVVSVAAALYYTFLLSDIIITGNDAYSPEYIVEISGLELGQHMFFADLEEAKARIEEDPYLQVDNISYIFPSRVRMDITERKEAAGIIGLDYNVIIDHNGYVLSMSGGTDLSGLLQVTGISMSGFQLGQRIGESSDFGTASLISLIDKLEQYELVHKIRSIDMTTPLAIVMYTQYGFKLHIGQPTDLDTKFQSLQTLLPRFEEKMIYTGTLYLSAKGGTVYSPQGAENVAAENASVPTDADTLLPDTLWDNGTIDDTPSVPDDTTPTDPLVTPPPATPTPDPMYDEFQG